MDWPERGIYFFRELGENRSDTGEGPRIVRIGTHAVTAESRSKLWTRLSQHRGSLKTGGGNHRGSIFRLIVGTALIDRDRLDFPTWDNGKGADTDSRSGEFVLEQKVSEIIGHMPFLWLAIEDEASPNSLRSLIERNAIALLSNYNKPEVDLPSQNWLGRRSDRELVRKSGLWNQDFVEKDCDPTFLDILDRLVSDM